MDTREKIKIGKKLWYRKNWWIVALIILSYGIGFVLFILLHSFLILVVFSFLWIFSLGFMNNRKMAFVEELVFDSGKSDEYFASLLSKRNKVQEEDDDIEDAAFLMKEMELSLRESENNLLQDEDDIL